MSGSVWCLPLPLVSVCIATGAAGFSSIRRQPARLCCFVLNGYGHYRSSVYHSENELARVNSVETFCDVFRCGKIDRRLVLPKENPKV
ncbi:MAG: hypothetical protein LBT46_02275 [Planctomycetaceae bacterium]|nr:hypothetical protein [Planctomycetaceae bacterium]